MRISTKIMAHPKREQFIPHLVEQLGITEDDVIWDEKQDRWDTGRRAWAAVDQTADYGLVIQDDALVARDLIAGLEIAAASLPEQCLVSPYIGTRRPAASRVERAVKAAQSAEASWVRMPSLNWGVAIMAPTAIINTMLPWCDRQMYPNYDRRIGRYAIDVLRMNTWCTWPSLVDHRDDQSLVGHGQGRKAHRFIGEEASALDVDWTRGHVDLTGIGKMNQPRQARRLAIPQSGTYTPKLNDQGYRQARQLRVAKRRLFGDDIPPTRPGA